MKQETTDETTKSRSDMTEEKAFAIMKKGGYRRDMFGTIHFPSKDHVETPEETEALDYLWLEWDYSVER